MSEVPVVAFLWEHYSQYHMDRCRAVAEAFSDRAKIVGFEIASSSAVYAGWGESGEANGFTKVTLFPGTLADGIGSLARFRALRKALNAHQVDHLFIAGYERPWLFALATLSRFSSRRVYVMLDSKFDDKPRRIALETLKRVLMLPYRGAFGAGRRTRDYLRFLGFRTRPVVDGYDTVSLKRLRALAPAARSTWESRAFLAVARFVPKKSLSTAIQAYARYRERGGSARRLRLCGSGALEEQLQDEAEQLGMAEEIDFLGFQPQDAIAREMANALCLLLPSTEEQWGLVVNEALAFGLPVLVSTNAGAVDLLVTPLGNGFALDPDDVDSWTEAMLVLGSDRVLWDRLAAGSAKRAPLGDVAAFVEGVSALTGLDGAPGRTAA